MKKSYVFVLICLFLVLSACSVSTTDYSDVTEQTKKDENEIEFKPLAINNKEELAAQIEQAVNGFSEEFYFSGAVYVGVGESDIFTKGVGFADYEELIENTIATKFLIGTSTTEFTAAAILMLEEEGYLYLDDPITEFFPEQTHWEEITIQHLLSMSSGIVNYMQEPYFSQIPEWVYTTTDEGKDLDVIMGIFENEELTFAPGEEFGYSFSNYILLGRIIEQVTGMPYHEYIQENIFNPLEMTNSGIGYNWINEYDKAIGHSMIGEGYADEMELYNTGGVDASAGIYSTVIDLSKWYKAMNTNEILLKEAVQKMLSTHTYIENSVPNATQYNYGLGTFLDERNVVVNVGEMLGYTNLVHFEPETGVLIIILGNHQRIHNTNNTLKDILVDVVYGRE
ncbi:serine hydrolase domain-containing protein [Chengkuizengella axinellae]|uniref:Serine hydrolase domain-containing protein n=1 Tax=Chengkuizengella axinellae TaxID=3064388 RepID=A0ABT9IX15_9BACL|nr:serine hydrolase domain-containing protein [Chengkuizengella sp. 2205SS18-9]MDP5273911.1 serine hydrolase domain-containing protein [Chengkuizengella sp. 2205SS18-9]